MVKQIAPTWKTRQSRLLHELIQERGLTLGDYALFFVTGEGTYLPASTPAEKIEEASGFVLGKDGRVYAFWLGWDSVQERPALTEWEEVTPESHWAASAEYRDARRQVGLKAG